MQKKQNVTILKITMYCYHVMRLTYECEETKQHHLYVDPKSLLLLFFNFFNLNF